MNFTTTTILLGNKMIDTGFEIIGSLIMGVVILAGTIGLCLLFISKAFKEPVFNDTDPIADYVSARRRK